MTASARIAWNRLAVAIGPWADLVLAAIALIGSAVGLANPALLPSAVQIVLALGFCLLLPGYALGEAMFPGVRDGAERIAIVTGLGLVLPPTIGLTLHVFGIGIGRDAWILGIGTVTAIGLATAALRRRASAPRRPPTKVSADERAWTAWAFGAAVLICVLALTVRTADLGAAATNFTQLWVRSEVQGAERRLHLGVANHESGDLAYRLVVLVDGLGVDTRVLTLGTGETWQDTVAIDPGSAERVEALLYRLPDAVTPYRRVSVSLSAP